MGHESGTAFLHAFRWLPLIDQQLPVTYGLSGWFPISDESAASHNLVPIARARDALVVVVGSVPFSVKLHSFMLPAIFLSDASG